MAQRKTKKSKTKISIRTILFVIIILAAVAALITFFIYQHEGDQSRKNKGPSASQIEIKQTSPPILSSKPTKSVVDGNWVNDDNGVMLDFHHAKFSIDSPSVDNHTFYKGSFTISKDKIIFNFNGKNNPCPNQRGIYTYTLKNNQLVLKAISDSCNIRKQKLDGAWAHF